MDEIEKILVSEPGLIDKEISSRTGKIVNSIKDAKEVGLCELKNTTIREIERMGNYSCMNALVEYYNSKVEKIKFSLEKMFENYI